MNRSHPSLVRGLLMALVGFILFVPAVPIQSMSEVLACNPCDCPQDDRMNCQGIEFYGLYYRYDRNGDCYFETYLIVPEREQGRFAFRVTAAELAKLPASVEENTLIKQRFGIAMYQLTSGEFQVNAGPNAEGKVYVIKFRGCPAYDIVEESFVPTH